MRKLAIDLTYQPTGGTLTQIIEIIKNVDSYDFAKVIFYITSDNLNLFEGANENLYKPIKNTSLYDFFVKKFAILI